MNDFIEECVEFPNGAHDDQVDAMTQALLRWNMPRVQQMVCISPEEYERRSQISPI